MDVTTHLMGAASAYEKFVGRYDRRSFKDPFYYTRIVDFQKSAERGRCVLLQLKGGKDD